MSINQNDISTRWKPIIIFSFLFYANCSFAQKIDEDLFIDITHINTAIYEELSLGSKPLDTLFKVSKIFEYLNGELIEKMNPQPISFRRDSVNYLPLTTEYYYRVEDSLITSIIYDWERFKNVDFKSKVKLLVKENRRDTIYINEFNRIFNYLAERYDINTEDCRITSTGKVCIWEEGLINLRLELVHSEITCRIRLWVKRTY